MILTFSSVLEATMFNIILKLLAPSLDASRDRQRRHLSRLNN